MWSRCISTDSDDEDDDNNDDDGVFWRGIENSQSNIDDSKNVRLTGKKERMENG